MKMQRDEMEKMRRRVKALQRQLGELGPVMRGSVVVIGMRYKRAYFSLNKKGKTRLIYLGKRREGIARQYSANYKKLRAIVEEMTELNMELLKHSYEL